MGKHTAPYEPRHAAPAAPWYTDHANVVTLVNYLAANDYDSTEIARAVEKPWAYVGEFTLAQATR